jgi:hypothetical protein
MRVPRRQLFGVRGVAALSSGAGSRYRHASFRAVRSASQTAGAGRDWRSVPFPPYSAPCTRAITRGRPPPCSRNWNRLYLSSSRPPSVTRSIDAPSYPWRARTGSCAGQGTGRTSSSRGSLFGVTEVIKIPLGFLMTRSMYIRRCRSYRLTPHPDLRNVTPLVQREAQSWERTVLKPGRARPPP